jgi:thymidine kinase
MEGSIDAIIGGMFSGKSSELARRVERVKIAKRCVIAFKPAIDNRYSKDNIVTHSGYEVPAYAINELRDIRAVLKLHGGCDTIAIDEAQFFEQGLPQLLESLAYEGHHIVVAGLDTDFRGEPFPVMAQIVMRADNVIKLRAICKVCGEDASRTQRLLGGIPAVDGSVVQVGGEESYEARCRRCFVHAGVPEKIFHEKA